MKSPAFSLVEMLIATSIVAVLSLLLIPGIARMQDSAHSTRCLANLRQLGAGLLGYAADHESAFPPGAHWDREVIGYLDISDTNAPVKALTCPSDPRPQTLSNGRFPRSYSASAIKPADSSQGVFRGSESSLSRRLAEIPKPGSTILLFEMFSNNAGQILANEQFNKNSFAWSHGYQAAGSIPRLPDGRYYHGQTMNYLFVDGHAAAMNPKDIFTPPNLLWRAFTP